MSKLRIGVNDDQIVRELIDAMLSKHNVGYDHVKANPKIDGVNWFQYYTWTAAEEASYKEWFINYWQQRVLPRLPKTRLEKEWTWYSLMWGLKVVE